MSSRFMTFTISGSISYGSAGTLYIMFRKLAQYDREFCGYTKGWPMDFLYAYAAIVRSLAKSLAVVMSIWSLLSTARVSGWKLDSEQTMEERIAIGCAVDGYP